MALADRPLVFDQLRRKMRDSVLASDHGHLLFGWRLKLWQEMQTIFDDSTFRRNLLTYIVAFDTLGHWGSDPLIPEFEEEWRNEYVELPPRIVRMLGTSLMSSTPHIEEIVERCHWLNGCYDYVVDSFISRLAEGTALAIGAVGWRISGLDDNIYTDYGWYDQLGTETTLETIDDLTAVGDRDCCDTHFWAANLAARVPSGGRGDDKEARRYFWLRWIDEWLPRVLGTNDELKRYLPCGT